MMNDTWLGWHFLAADRRLQFEPRILVQVGQTLAASGALVLGWDGLHACRRAIDALNYAPGPVVCRVRLSGEIVDGVDMACARERTCLWMADATATLHEFAYLCAEDALRTGKVDDRRWWDAIKTKRRWLKGQSTREELAVAQAAAWAAWDIAKDASWAAVWIAWSEWPACTTARSVQKVRDPARDAQNTRLESMLMELAPTVV